MNLLTSLNNELIEIQLERNPGKLNTQFTAEFRSFRNTIESYSLSTIHDIINVMQT